MVVSDFTLDDQEGGLVSVDAARRRAEHPAPGPQLFNNPLGVAIVANRAPAAALSARRRGVVAGGGR